MFDLEERRLGSRAGGNKQGTALRSLQNHPRPEPSDKLARPAGEKQQGSGCCREAGSHSVEGCAFEQELVVGRAAPTQGELCHLRYVSIA